MSTLRTSLAQLRAPFLGLALATGLAHSQTPAAPTPTTPPEGTRPPIPAIAPPPTFTPAPPVSPGYAATPLAPAQPSPGMPRPRPRVDCNSADNQKLPLCNQHKDPGIERRPAAKEDTRMIRTPPPTGDIAANRASPGAGTGMEEAKMGKKVVPGKPAVQAAAPKSKDN